MNQFRRELKDGCIQPYVDRNEVMRIPSAIEREGFLEKSTIKNSARCQRTHQAGEGNGMAFNKM